MPPSYPIEKLPKNTEEFAPKVRPVQDEPKIKKNLKKSKSKEYGKSEKKKYKKSVSIEQNQIQFDGDNGGSVTKRDPDNESQ